MQKVVKPSQKKISRALTIKEMLSFRKICQVLKTIDPSKYQNSLLRKITEMISIEGRVLMKDQTIGSGPEKNIIEILEDSKKIE